MGIKIIIFSTKFLKMGKSKNFSTFDCVLPFTPLSVVSKMKNESWLGIIHSNCIQLISSVVYGGKGGGGLYPKFSFFISLFVNLYPEKQYFSYRSRVVKIRSHFSGLARSDTKEERFTIFRICFFMNEWNGIAGQSEGEILKKCFFF